MEDPVERAQCWRWLAFALFYPPSKRIAGTARNCKRRWVDLSENMIDLSDIEASRRTLRNPAELVFQDEEALPTVNSVEVVTFVKGATFHLRRFSTSDVLLVLDDEAEFETLCERDGWICAVLPARGIGWVKTTQAVRLNQEKEGEDDVAKQLSSNSRCNGDLHLRIREGIGGIRLGDVFRSFIQLVDPHLSGLKLKHCHFLSRNCDAIPTIGASCVNPKPLVLQGCNLQDDSVNQLVDILSGNFGRNLTSLKMSGSSHMSRPVGGILHVLRLPNSLPVLQTFRLTVKDTQTLKSIYDFLYTRAKLVILEMHYRPIPLVPTPHWSNDFDNITRDDFLTQY